MAWTGDLLFMFFYLGMTAIVYVALVAMPSDVIEQTVQPIALDALIFDQRINQKLSAISAVRGIEHDTLTSDVSRALLLNPSPKKYGAKITVGENTIYYNQDYYEATYPLAPYKYHRFISEHSKLNNNQPVRITVDQTYPQTYG